MRWHSFWDNIDFLLYSMAVLLIQSQKVYSLISKI